MIAARGSVLGAGFSVIIAKVSVIADKLSVIEDKLLPIVADRYLIADNSRVIPNNLALR